MNDDLSEERIAAALRGRWRGPVRFFEVIGSTNDEALAWAESGAPEGALVVAGHQTGGRGRRGRTWWSAPGRSLLFTVILRPERPPAELDLLTTAAGVACARAVEDLTGLQPRLKWPNDLILEDRKLGGILVESRVAKDRLHVAVVGIGINLFDLSEAPVDIASRATSLAAELGKIGRDSPAARVDLLASIVGALEELYPGLDAQAIVTEATRRSAILGRLVRIVRADGSAVEGRAESLSPSGMLEVDAGDGRRLLDSGEVTAIEPLTG